MKVIFTISIITISLYAVTAYSQIDINSSLVTKYVWRGIDFLGDCPAIQPSLTYTFGESGISTNLWGSAALTKRAESDIRCLDELDLTLSYDLTMRNTNLSLGGVLYNCPNTANWPDEYSVNSEIFLGLTLDRSPFKPQLTSYYAINDKNWDGLYIGASVCHTLNNFSSPVDLKLSIGYSNQSLVTDISNAGFSDVNLNIASTLEQECYYILPSFTATYVPDDRIYKDGFIFWGGIVIGYGNNF